MTRAALLLLFLSSTILADWQSRHERGEQLLAQGRTEEAIAELTAGLAEATGRGRGAVLDVLGRAEHQSGRYQLAKRHLEASVPLWEAGSRARAAALNNVGSVYLALEEYAHAEIAFRQALDIMPGEAKIWQNAGQAQFLLGRHREAEASLRQALSLADGELSSSIFADLANLQHAAKQYAKAADILREAIAQTGPGRQRARMRANLGVIHWKRSAKNEAAFQLRLALDEMEAAVGPEHPDVAKILEDYQEVLRKTGQKQEAIAAAKRAAAIRLAFTRHTSDRRTVVDWRELFQGKGLPLPLDPIPAHLHTGQEYALGH